MEPVKGTPMGETAIIEFDSHLLHLAQTAPGKITISFDELSKNMKHEAKDFTLQKINYRTVLGSLKNSHPQILSASLSKNPDEVWCLTVRVAYEFLPVIEETILLEKKEIPPEQSEQMAINNTRNYLHNIKEQLAELVNNRTLTGSLEHSDSLFEIYTKLTHKTAVYTWALNLVRPHTNNYKLQMYYFNSVSKARKNSKVLPEEGLYLAHNGETAQIEVRLLAVQDDYDTIILVVEGKHEGTYTLSIEKVEIAA